MSAFVAVSFGCSEAVPRELADARQAYARAEKGPARDLNPAQLHAAQQQLKIAEKTFDDEGGNYKTRDRSYIAMRTAQVADVQARTLASQQEEQKWQQEALDAQQRAFARTRSELASGQQQLQTERMRREQAEAQAAQVSGELARIAAVKQDQRGTIITLPGGVLFQSGQSELMASAREKLGQVAQALKSGDPQGRIVVEGHTDSRGSNKLNQRLSQERADAVREYLVSQGLTDQQVESKGMGEEQPVADNESAEGRANNRRVEIVVERSPGANAQQGSAQQPMTGQKPTPGAAGTQPGATGTQPGATGTQPGGTQPGGMQPGSGMQTAPLPTQTPGSSTQQPGAK